MMSDPLLRNFDAAVHKARQRKYKYGVLGRPDGVIAVADRPGFVHVRMSSEANRSATVARNPGVVPLRLNLPVKMEEDRNVLVIVGLDTGAILDAATGGDATNPYGIEKHTHRLGTNLEYTVEALRLEPGQLYPAGGLLAGIRAFRYYYAGAWATFEDATASLGTYRPTTTGHHAWVLVGVNPATNGIVTVAGASQIYATALTIDQIDDIAFGDYIPCGAVQLRNDDTAVTDITKYQDAHGWFEAPSSPIVDAEAAQDAVGAALLATATITPAYNDATPSFSWDVNPASITAAMLADGAALAEILDDDGAGSLLDADLLDGVQGAGYALAGHLHAGEDITSGTIADARIASTITRDSEVMTIVLAGDGAGSGLDADLLDGLSSAAFELAGTAAAAIVTHAALPDPHTGYFLLAGRAGGQIGYGGEDANESLTLEGTLHATKTTSYLLLQPNGGNVGIRNSAPAAVLHVSADDTAPTGHVFRVGNVGGIELIASPVDRDFSGAGNWTGANWAISGGTLLHTPGSTADAVLANANLTAGSIISGRRYAITFTVSGRTAGTIIPKIGTLAAEIVVSSNGTFTGTITANATDADLKFTPTSVFDGAIDNISIVAVQIQSGIQNNGFIGLGTITPSRFSEIRADSSTLLTALGLYNANTTALNGVVLSFRSDTTGAGATPFTEFGAMRLQYIEHDHATQSSEYTFLCKVAGASTSVLTLSRLGYICGVGVSAATALLHLGASGTARASFRINSGSAPTTPNSGDFWFVTSGRLMFHRGVTTETVATGVAGAAITQTYNTPARTVNAYTTDAEAAYTGQDNAQAGAVYAKYADLEALRVAYTNLEASHLNLLQVMTALIDDHQAFGITG